MFFLGRSRAFAARAIFAAIVACALILQGGAPGALGKLAHADEQASVLQASSAEHCSAGEHTGDPDQSHKKTCHSQCCIMCSQGGRDATPPFVAVAFIVAVYSAPEPIGPATYPALDEPWKRSSGWASSWSSRAPPFFS